jgi:pyruvate dehydrogenase E1 component
VQWALEAQRLLQVDWNVQADVWSVTSWNELRRDGLATDEHNFLNPDGDQRVPYLTKALDGAPGPFVAVSDFMRAVQDQIAPWVPGTFTSLGTDGYGLSDTRGALRRHFKVDAASITVKVLGELAKHGDLKPETMREAIDRYQLTDITAAPTTETAGGAE